jgi:hypothetical protein
MLVHREGKEKRARGKKTLNNKRRRFSVVALTAGMMGNSIPHGTTLIISDDHALELKKLLAFHDKNFLICIIR